MRTLSSLVLALTVLAGTSVAEAQEVAAPVATTVPADSSGAATAEIRSLDDLTQRVTASSDLIVDLTSVTADTRLNLVTVSALAAQEGDLATFEVARAAHEAGLAIMQSAVSSNPVLSKALADAGYEAASVVAVTPATADATVTLFLDDSVK